MQSLDCFIVKPRGDRYNNKVSVDGGSLITNTNIESFRHINKEAIVVSIPKNFPTQIKVGDRVLIHHNVFRRYRDIRGKEKNGKSYYKDNIYVVSPDLIFAKIKEDKIYPLNGFNFVKPIKEDKMFSIDFEKPLIGILKYKDSSLKVMTIGDLVGFRPGSEYEFFLNKERLYRVPTNSITIKYEYQGNEEEYNPSWAQSG